MIELHNMDCMDYLRECDDNAFDLAIVDPPYFEIKGGFDFAWGSFGEYIDFVRDCGKEIARVTSENGTVYWWGDDKNIAYTQVVLDEYLDLQNSLVWYKHNLRGGMFGSAGGDTVRSFPVCTERCLMYSKDKLNLTSSVYLIRDYIRGEINKKHGKIIFKQINSALGTATNGGGVASACLSLDKKEPAMITKEMYKKLQNWCDPFMRKEYEELRKEYEELRKEYEELRRPFDNSLGLSEVLVFDQPTIDNKKTGHPTPKAPKVAEAIVRTSGRAGGRALVPFMGSGTEVIAASNFGMSVVGIELDKDYFEAAKARIDRETRQETLF